MKANSLGAFYPGVWERRLMNHFYGFNTDARTNRIDEYELYNRIRRERYAEENRIYRRGNRIIMGALAILVLLLFV